MYLVSAMKAVIFVLFGLMSEVQGSFANLFICLNFVDNIWISPQLSSFLVSTFTFMCCDKLAHEQSLLWHEMLIPLFLLYW